MNPYVKMLTIVCEPMISSMLGRVYMSANNIPLNPRAWNGAAPDEIAAFKRLFDIKGAARPLTTELVLEQSPVSTDSLVPATPNKMIRWCPSGRQENSTIVFPHEILQQVRVPLHHHEKEILELSDGDPDSIFNEVSRHLLNLPFYYSVMYRDGFVYGEVPGFATPIDSCSLPVAISSGNTFTHIEDTVYR
jgi:hypothetical protein